MSGIGFLGQAFALVVTVIGLLSGALSVVREVQLMYHPAAAESRRVFWAFVRIAFVIAAVVLYLNEHKKAVDEHERVVQLSKPASIEVKIPSINVPPAQVVITPEPGSGIRKADRRRDAGKLIDRFANLARHGSTIQEAWLATNDTTKFKSDYQQWVTNAVNALDSTLGSSYSVQFTIANGSAMMGCPEGHSMDGCGYWQAINGKKDVLMGVITEVRQRQ